MSKRRNYMKEAMRRELDRGGQVYYLHNRVSNIENTAKGLAEMLDGDASAASFSRRCDIFSADSRST